MCWKHLLWTLTVYCFANTSAFAGKTKGHPRWDPVIATVNALTAIREVKERRQKVGVFFARSPCEQLPSDQPDTALIGGDAFWVSLCPEDDAYEWVLKKEPYPSHPYPGNVLPKSRFHIVAHIEKPPKALLGQCDFIASEGVEFTNVKQLKIVHKYLTPGGVWIHKGASQRLWTPSEDSNDTCGCTFLGLEIRLEESAPDPLRDYLDAQQEKCLSPLRDQSAWSEETYEHFKWAELHQLTRKQSVKLKIERKKVATKILIDWKSHLQMKNLSKLFSAIDLYQHTRWFNEDDVQEDYANFGAQMPDRPGDAPARVSMGHLLPPTALILKKVSKKAQKDAPILSPHLQKL